MEKDTWSEILNDTWAYQNAIRETKTYKKFINYIDGLQDKIEFLEELRWFRKHIENAYTHEPFPLEGIPLPQKAEEFSTALGTYDRIYDEKAEDYLNNEEYEKRRKRFIKKYGLELFDDSFDLLLYYGSVKPMEMLGYCRFFDVVDFQNYLSMEPVIFDGKEIFGEKDYKDVYRSFEYLSKGTPIALFIHPYMSERDIIDAVRKTYKVRIKPLQESYKSKDINLQKVRTKSKKLKDRNDYIFENRELPIKELTQLVNQKFRDGEHYDYTYIQSILRSEVEKRNLSDST